MVLCATDSPNIEQAADVQVARNCEGCGFSFKPCFQIRPMGDRVEPATPRHCRLTVATQRAYQALGDSLDLARSGAPRSALRGCAVAPCPAAVGAARNRNIGNPSSWHRDFSWECEQPRTRDHRERDECARRRRATQIGCGYLGCPTENTGQVTYRCGLSPGILVCSPGDSCPVVMLDSRPSSPRRVQVCLHCQQTDVRGASL